LLAMRFTCHPWTARPSWALEYRQRHR
jgi:hypothetical protein